MAITPLYSLEEINTEIAQAKIDLAKARSRQSYSKGTMLQVEREKLNNLQNHLEWLQSQRMQLEGVTGLQSIVARVPRG